MTSMRLAFALTALSTACGLAAAAPTTVNGSTSSLVSLGSFAAGTYSITATGLIDLTYNGGFVIRPDGVPNAPITFAGYSYFNPSGSYTVGGDYGPAGTNAKIGALIGTLNPSASLFSNPTAAHAADWFLIGYNKTLTLATAGNIYAAVNDTYVGNNTGAFQVSVTAVPEPAQWALALAGGLALLGLQRRRGAGR